MSKYLNAGCGDIYNKSPEWVNADFGGKRDGVVQVNLLGRLPWDDNTFDAVFSSNMLEHFTKIQGQAFVKECIRILKPGGILRIVVPDLEDVCREYIRVLDSVRSGAESDAHYEAISIELLDQVTRMSMGGELAKFMASDRCDKEYMSERFGQVDCYIQDVNDYRQYTGFRRLKKRIRQSVYDMKDKWVEKSVSAQIKKAGRFALSGEVHRWMYDEYSLKCLFENTGFVDVTRMKCNNSAITGWSNYELELTSDGHEYKPHNIYLEGKKPQ